jgi:hypothetical protein
MGAAAVLRKHELPGVLRFAASSQQKRRRPEIVPRHIIRAICH